MCAGRESAKELDAFRLVDLRRTAGTDISGAAWANRTRLQAGLNKHPGTFHEQGRRGAEGQGSWHLATT